jgi:hypothetical protein
LTKEHKRNILTGQHPNRERAAQMKVVDGDTGKSFSLDHTDELSNDLRTFYEAQCAHTKTSVRRRPYGGGAIHFCQQCLECGRSIGTALKKTKELENSPFWDVTAEQIYTDHREATRLAVIQKHVRIQRDRLDGFKREYEKYLKTEAWALRRAMVLNRAAGICEGCLGRKATQVHHKTYAHIQDEFMFELIAVCDECHQRLHPEKHSEEDGIDLISEWREGLPCEGCRYGSEKDGRPWCFILEAYATDALSEVGGCGPKRAAFEPLR